MTLDQLLVFLLVGLVAGFLASHVMAGRGFGLIGDILIGIVGALLGAWLFQHVLNITASGLLGEIVVAFIGAAILIGIVRLFAGGRFGRRRAY
ncbi:MAG TPA: GlsB/YeaQ/YmgE family stress response membrane protein [Candidatus Dormibacteraeota bacterium]